jgi:hypothetical protein
MSSDRPKPEQTRQEGGVEDGGSMSLDHLMWGAPSLEVGLGEAERLFGVKPSAGGSHPGLGTCNALLGLEGGVYLEVIAPDPEQETRGTFGEKLQQLTDCALITWAASCHDLVALKQRGEAAGLDVRGPASLERSVPGGDRLSWKLLFLSGHEFGPLVPFFIDWLESPHPSAVNPQGGRLERLEIVSPNARALGQLLSRLGAGVEVVEGDVPALRASVETKQGLITLASTEETRGFAF